MSQRSLCDSGFERHPVKTRKRLFLEQMEQVVPWAELVALITPHAPAGGGAKGGRPPFRVETMLRIHFLQQWFNLSDPAMQEALHDIPMFRRFAGLDLGEQRMPDESTILRFRHLLEKYSIGAQILARVNALLTEKGLLFRAGTLVDATIISAPVSSVQASVRVCESALPGFSEEHCAVAHAVCAVEPVDGAQAIAACQGMIASKTGQNASFAERGGIICPRKDVFELKICEIRRQTKK